MVKKNRKDWTKWNRQMGGRSLNITSGAFGDFVLYMVCHVHKRCDKKVVLGGSALAVQGLEGGLPGLAHGEPVDKCRDDLAV